MPIGAGAMSGLNCHASPPSPSGTTFGALSWNLRGRYCFQTCGGSRMCESAETRWYSRAMPGFLRPLSYEQTFVHFKRPGPWGRSPVDLTQDTLLTGGRVPASEEF